MMEKKIILKGSLFGTNKIKKYKNPDILYSKINNTTYNKNNILIKHNSDKHFIYHSYDKYNDEYKRILSGRWYDLNFIFDSNSMPLSKFDSKNKTLTIEFDNFEIYNEKTGKSKFQKMKTIIYLTDLGYKKLHDYMNN